MLKARHPKTRLGEEPSWGIRESKGKKPEIRKKRGLYEHGYANRSIEQTMPVYLQAITKKTTLPKTEGEKGGNINDYRCSQQTDAPHQRCKNPRSENCNRFLIKQENGDKNLH